jgi:hypothetical protein
VTRRIDGETQASDGIGLFIDANGDVVRGVYSGTLTTLNVVQRVGVRDVVFSLSDAGTISGQISTCYYAASNCLGAFRCAGTVLTNGGFGYSIDRAGVIGAGNTVYPAALDNLSFSYLSTKTVAGCTNNAVSSTANRISLGASIGQLRVPAVPWRVGVPDAQP